MHLIKKLKKSKKKEKAVSDQSGGTSGATSLGGSRLSLVPGTTGISTAGSDSNQTRPATATSPQPSNTAIVHGEPTDQSQDKGTRQGPTVKNSPPKTDDTNQHAQGLENEPKSSLIPLSPKQEDAKLASRTRGQRFRDGAILALDFTSTISGATDLLKPVKAVADAIKKVLEIPKEIADMNANWTILEKRLKFHLATLDSQQAQLEEDEKIDGSTPEPNAEIKQVLDDYRRELNDICLLLSEEAPSGTSAAGRSVDINHNKGLIAQRCQDLDDIFKRYTTSLQILVASTVSRMMDGIQRLDEKIEREADKTHENRLKGHNVYGKQHVICLKGTRINTLNAIRRWVDNKDSPQWMFCLLDVAGSGKSTVAKHMAEEWKQEDRLVARFFFSRDTTETMSTNRFCSTVAGLFAEQSTGFKEELDKFRDRSDLSFEERFEGMITTPLKALNGPAILTIDALDECNNEYQSRDELLQTLTEQCPSIPQLRVLVTGRPEFDIKRWAEATGGYTNFSRLEGGSRDVELYIESRLQSIPLDDRRRLYSVICQAEGLFIWARIACDLLMKTSDVEGLLEILGQEVSLDYLYRIALEQSLPEDKASRQATLIILQMILAAQRPLCIAELEKLAPKSRIVEPVVTSLGSFLLYDGREGAIRLLHATFREYVTDRSKRSPIFAQIGLGHHFLASGCINLVEEYSKEEVDLWEMDEISKRKGVLIADNTLVTII
ncbi:hypothetical protein CPB86DRAFT_878577 [Serendipita vermifera]|nr:hypothetical protein CPB86DRAFT_878577 [Serendipita vermifera]